MAELWVYSLMLKEKKKRTPSSSPPQYLENQCLSAPSSEGTRHTGLAFSRSLGAILHIDFDSYNPPVILASLPFYEALLECFIPNLLGSRISTFKLPGFTLPRLPSQFSQV